MSQKILLVAALFCACLKAQVAVVNAASFSTNQGVAAGSWAAAFGNFPGVATTTVPAPPFPTQVAGVKLTIAGIESPLFDVRSSQITFLVPRGVTAGVQPVVVTTPLGIVNGTVRIVSAGPGIFVKDAATPPKGAIANQSGLENTSTLRAARGEVISIYGTGAAAFRQSYTDGAAPGASPLVETAATPQVFIGGVEAEVRFSGLNPFSPGLWQINVVVPSQSFITGRVPVTVYMNGVDSNEVTLFVQ